MGSVSELSCLLPAAKPRPLESGQGCSLRSTSGSQQDHRSPDSQEFGPAQVNPEVPRRQTDTHTNTQQTKLALSPPTSTSILYELPTHCNKSLLIVFALCNWLLLMSFSPSHSSSSIALLGLFDTFSGFLDDSQDGASAAGITICILMEPPIALCKETAKYQMSLPVSL